VLAYGEQVCIFCDSTETPPLSEETASARDKAAVCARVRERWRAELDPRLQAYRSRRGKAPNGLQPALPFDDDFAPGENVALDVEEDSEERQLAAASEFAFTIAIGRTKTPEPVDPRLLIDVSVPPQLEAPAEKPEPPPQAHAGLFPVATLAERKHALLIDAACLAFAYGGFLALFGSLGGHFILSKLSATVCFFTFAFVYLQYFGLFTIFGGSTPGMMVCGLHVASSTGDVPTPRQYFLRAVGYMLSAGTCFLGFLWLLWDEDGLTWHDRLSETYLARIESLGDEDFSHSAAAR
jgi:uncharacterized RDD family membrane protein YckC